MTTNTPAATPAMIYPAIVAVMREIDPIAKSSRNQQQSYNFRGVDAVYNAVHPVFARHGVFSTSAILDAQHHTTEKTTGAKTQTIVHAILKMRFTFWAADGSSVSTEVIGEGVDYGGDKASNKAMSVADKYAILQLLKIPTAMVDADKTPHERPDHDRSKPAIPPRDDRIAKTDLEGLVAAWKAMMTLRSDEVTPEAFAAFAYHVADIPKARAREYTDWSKADLQRAHTEIEMEVARCQKPQT